MSLAAAHEDEALVEVEVLHAQLAALRQAEAAAVDQRGHEARGAVHGIEQGGGFRQAQDDGQVGAAPGTCGELHVLHVHAQHLAAEEQHGAHGLVLGAGGDALADGEVGGVVAHGLGVDAGPRLALALGEVVEEAAGPVRVALLGANGVVARAQPQAQLLERGEGRDLSLAVHHGVGRYLAPVGAAEEVNEVEAQGLLGLADLPILRSSALHVFAEPADPVGQCAVGGGAGEELADVPDAVGRGGFVDESGLEKELGELLEGGLEIAHRWHLGSMEGQCPCHRCRARGPSRCRAIPARGLSRLPRDHPAPIFARRYALGLPQPHERGWVDWETRRPPE